MACGVPVVCADNSSLPEEAGDAAVLANAADIDGLADAMKQALIDPALRARLVERGFRQAARFSWKDAARRLLDVYNRLDRRVI